MALPEPAPCASRDRSSVALLRSLKEEQVLTEREVEVTSATSCRTVWGTGSLANLSRATASVTTWADLVP